MKKKISIIVCVYNEIDRLPNTLEKIKKWLIENNFNYDIDLNIVDDGSTDETSAFIESYKELEINLIKKKHSGLMSSILFGFQKINADFYILLAADLPVSLNFLDDFLKQIDHYDIIQGSRYLGHDFNKISHKRPAGRVILSTSLSILFQLFFKCNVKDPQIDFKIFSKKIVDQIIPNLKLEHDGLKMTEILVRAFASNLKILEKKTDYTYLSSDRLVPNISLKELPKFLYTAISCFMNFFKMVFIYRKEFKNQNIKENPLRFL